MEKNYKEIKRTIIFLACFLPHIAAILVGMSADGMYFGLQGGNAVYGSKAIGVWYYTMFFPFIFASHGLLASMRIFTLPALIYQTYYLIRNRKKKSVLIFTGVMTVLLIVGGIVSTPISRERRANKDIEPYVMNYLTEAYGSDAVADMKIVIEKIDFGRFSVAHSFTKFYYTVTGPLFEEPLKILYTREWHSPGDGKEDYTTHKVEEGVGRFPN